MSQTKSTKVSLSQTAHSCINRHREPNATYSETVIKIVSALEALQSQPVAKEN